MERIDTHPVYLLGKWLDSVFLHARLPLKTNLFGWQSARNTLDFMIAQGPGRGEFGLNESVRDAISLSTKLTGVLKRFEADPETVLSEPEALELQTSISLFEYVLARDLGHLPTYFVTRKGILDTDYLIKLA